MNLGRYIKNAAITATAAAAIFASACAPSGNGHELEKNSPSSYVQHSINPDVPATYVFDEIMGDCNLREEYLKFSFLEMEYYNPERVVRIITDGHRKVGFQGRQVNATVKTYGSGYQISPDLVLTVYHAVNIDTRQSVEVRRAGNVVTEARVVAADQRNDLALLEPEDPAYFDDTVRFRAAIDPYQTAVVRAINTSDQWYLHSESRMNISIPIRETSNLTVKDGIDGSLARISYPRGNPPLFPGMSGSAIVDDRNRIMGVVSAIGIGDTEVFGKSPTPQDIVRFLDAYCHGSNARGYLQR